MEHRHHILSLIAAVAASLLVWGCSTTRHVPEGEYLLDKVRINVDDPEGDVSSAELVNYLRQQPNHKVLGFWKLQNSRRGERRVSRRAGDHSPLGCAPQFDRILTTIIRNLQ